MWEKGQHTLIIYLSYIFLCRFHIFLINIDLNLPFEHNFNYYCADGRCNDYDIKQYSLDPKTCSALNCNIRSLTANFDSPHNMLAQLNFPFLKLVLQKLNFGRTLNIYQMLTCQDLTSQPSLSNAGKVTFYISYTLNYALSVKVFMDCKNEKKFAIN